MKRRDEINNMGKNFEIPIRPGMVYISDEMIHKDNTSTNSVVKSEKLYSIAEYCEQFLGFYPGMHGTTEDELQKILNENGYDHLWSRPLSEIDEVLESGKPVVLVDCSYRTNDGTYVGKYVSNIRWVEIPDRKAEPVYMVYFNIDSDGDFAFSDYRRLNNSHVYTKDIELAQSTIMKHLKQAIDTFTDPKNDSVLRFKDMMIEEYSMMCRYKDDLSYWSDIFIDGGNQTCEYCIKYLSELQK